MISNPELAIASRSGEARWTDSDLTVLNRLLDYQDEQTSDVFPDPKVAAELVGPGDQTIAKYRKARADDVHSEASVVLDALRTLGKGFLADELRKAWGEFNYRASLDSRSLPFSATRTQRSTFTRRLLA